MESAEKPKDDECLSKPTKICSFEDILDLCGTDGWRNYTVFILASLSTMISPLHLFSYEFLGDTPKQYRCEVSQLENSNLTNQQIYDVAIPFSIEDGEKVYSGCKMYDFDFSLMANLTFEEIQKMIDEDEQSEQVIYCDRRVFEGNIDSIVTEWDLVCERRALFSTTMASMQVGIFFGSLLFGYLPDAYGRAIVYKITSSFYIVSEFVASFSVSIQMFFVMKAFSAFLATGFYTAAFVLVMEQASLKQRPMMGNYYVIPWCFGIMLTAAICWAVRPWRYLQAALATPAFILPLTFWYIPESPRWLILNGQYEKALRIIKDIAKSNKKKLPSKEEMIDGMINIRTMNIVEEEKNNGTFFEKIFELINTLTAIVVHPSMRIRTAVVFISWISVSMGYYGISIGQVTLSTDPYLYILIGGVLELIAYISLWPIVAWLGRKKSLIMFCFICGVTILSVMFLNLYSKKEDFNWLKTVLFLAGKFSISAAFQLVWFFTAELYPTNLRSLAIGEASTVGRVGSICSPYINDILGQKFSWSPAAVFGVFSIGSGFAVFLLPETSDEKLPDSLKIGRSPESADSKET